MRVVYRPILYCALHRVHALQSAQPRHTDTVNHHNNHWNWINFMICCVKVAVWKSLFMFCSQPSCKPVVLNKYVLMFGFHHMGCIVSACTLSGCLVAIGCLKYGSEMERTCINSHILTAWLSSNLDANPQYSTSKCWYLGRSTWVALAQFVYCQVVWLQLAA